MEWTRTVIFFWVWIVVIALLLAIPLRENITGAAVADNSLGTSSKAIYASEIALEAQGVEQVYTNDRNSEHVIMYVELSNDAGEIDPILERMSIILYETYPGLHETVYAYRDHDIIGEASYNSDQKTLDVRLY